MTAVTDKFKLNATVPGFSKPAGSRLHQSHPMGQMTFYRANSSETKPA